MALAVKPAIAYHADDDIVDFQCADCPSTDYIEKGALSLKQAISLFLRLKGWFLVEKNRLVCSECHRKRDRARREARFMKWLAGEIDKARRAEIAKQLGETP